MLSELILHKYRSEMHREGCCSGWLAAVKRTVLRTFPEAPLSKSFQAIDYWLASEVFSLTGCCFGHIDELVRAPDSLLVRGWIFGLDLRLEELRLGLCGAEYSRALLIKQARIDVARTFRGESMALLSGFGASIPAATAADEVRICFEADFDDGSTVRASFPEARPLGQGEHPYFNLALNLH